MSRTHLHQGSISFAARQTASEKPKKRASFHRVDVRRTEGSNCFHTVKITIQFLKHTTEGRIITHYYKLSLSSRFPGSIYNCNYYIITLVLIIIIILIAYK